jgi:hypothetical protein
MTEWWCARQGHCWLPGGSLRCLSAVVVIWWAAGWLAGWPAGWLAAKQALPQRRPCCIVIGASFSCHRDMIGWCCGQEEPCLGDMIGWCCGQEEPCLAATGSTCVACRPWFHAWYCLLCLSLSLHTSRLPVPHSLLTCHVTPTSCGYDAFGGWCCYCRSIQERSPDATRPVSGGPLSFSFQHATQQAQLGFGF